MRGEADFNWKGLKLEGLQWAFEHMKFKRPPRWHQLVSLAFAADKQRAGFWHDVGTGKTLAAYWTSQMWGCKKILVICPGAALGSWMGDSQWTDYIAQIVSGTTPERKLKIGTTDVSVVQYEWLKTIYGRFSPRIRGGEVVGKSKEWIVDLGSFTQDFDCIIFDEIHRCNTNCSLQSKICLELSKRTKHVIGLSGTPVDKNLFELFHIHKVLDLGSTFGWNFWRFRFDHFHQEDFEWVPRDGMEKAILKKWSGVSLSFKREECFDLPECQEEVVRVPCSEEFEILEERIIGKKSIRVGGSSLVFPQASVQASKLKQLTDGFIYLAQEDGGREVYRLKENPKLEALMELFDGGIKTIVFHEFQEAGDLIAEVLQEKNIKFVRFKGGITPEERLSYEKAFQEDLAVQGAVVQISAGGEGWNGFAAGMVVFYDIVASPKIRKQCIGRMLRSGQVKKTLVVELVMQYSINEVTKLNQFERRSSVEDLMDYIRSYKRRHNEERLDG
jgi:SNF2 family DNA or RNA helicase